MALKPGKQGAVNREENVFRAEIEKSVKEGKNNAAAFSKGGVKVEEDVNDTSTQLARDKRDDLLWRLIQSLLKLDFDERKSMNVASGGSGSTAIPAPLGQC